MRKLIKLILIGYAAGALVGTLISMLTVEDWKHFYSEALLERIGSPAGAIFVHIALSALIGAAGFGGTLLYKTDLSLAAATAIHFAVIESVYLPVALILGWIPPSLPVIGAMTGIMLAAFLIIWGIMYIRYKRSARQLNELTKKKNDKREDA